MATKSRLAIYTGSFDPLTLGHLDIIERASALFDRIVVAVGVARGKAPFFSTEERVAMIEECVKSLGNVEARSFTGLAVDYAASLGAVAMIRGLRTSDDYTYEVTMAHMNRAMKPGLETLFLPTAAQYSHVSSSLAKEVASYGGDPTLLVPASVAARLKAKLAPA